MLHAVILICSLQGPCTSDSAIDVIKTPIRSALPTTCFFEGQAYIAQTEFGRTLRADEVIQIHCERDK